MNTEITYGIVIVYAEEENKFLILKSSKPISDLWSFPKGHTREGEKPEETALRELEEETGLREVKILNAPPILEQISFIRDGKETLKINKYFIGFVKDKNVKIPGGEIDDYKWASYDEALKLFISHHRREVLTTAKEYLESKH